LAGLSDFLRSCADTERLVRDFYRALAGAFPEPPQVRRLFLSLAEEEESHARTFDFLRSVAKDHEGRVQVKESFAGNVERLRKGIGRILAALGSEGGIPLHEALDWAILAESTTLERDKGAFVEVGGAEFRNLLKGLVTSDEGHRQQLEALRASLSAAA
jgi:rubrerythrin